MSSGDVVNVPDGSELTLGEIGIRVLLDNEHVPIWEVELEHLGEDGEAR